MKERSFIKDIVKKAGTKATICGFVVRKRDVGDIKFLLVKDKTGVAQVTLANAKKNKEMESIFGTLGQHDFICVKGEVPEKILAKVDIEIVPEEIKILGRSERPLPLDMSGRFQSELETRLNWRAISLRDPKASAIIKVESSLVEGFVKFLSENRFTFTFTPCLMGSPSESGAEVFPVVYFEKTAYLRQDPQLHRQLLILSGFDRIYEIGPSWRAELSHTTRHLCEHRNCAVEIAFIDDETEVMEWEERLIRSALEYTKKNSEEELELLGQDIELPSSRFPELRFPEVYDLLRELGHEIPYGEDLNQEAEVALGKYVKEKYRSDFFFVNRFPSKIKPFYVMRVDEEPEFARSIDLIYRGVEISSGGQREHRYEKIIEQAKEKKMNLQNLEWFTKFFKYGAPPHGGFSIGIERLTKQALGIPNILEAVAFPRTPERMVP
ncbi:MAG: aspartate--tRNA(Asn) ligase [Candidatus Micrarchaeaceae archaeon]